MAAASSDEGETSQSVTDDAVSIGNTEKEQERILLSEVTNRSYPEVVRPRAQHR